MTEEEIVSCLKENKNKGVAFCFMSEDVWNWVREHLDESKLLYLSPRGDWESLKDIDFDDFDNFVFALSDDYELPHKPSGEWVEFGIKKNGRFTAFDVDDNDHQISFSFGWHQWSEFLECSYKHDLGYTDFGGWQYESDSYWLTTPHVIGKEGLLTTLTNYDEDCKPALPLKIRFWRESR